MDDIAENLMSRWIEKKGAHTRFPRDAVVEWMKENWREL